MKARCSGRWGSECLRRALLALTYGSILFGSCVYLVACSVQRHPDISKSTDGALPYIEAQCSNGTRIRTLRAQIDADRTVGNSEASEAEGLLLDKELVICSNETHDKWTSQVAQLMAVADFHIDDNACRHKKQEFKSDEPYIAAIWTKLLFSCEATAGARRLDSATGIVNSTSFPDVRAFGKRIESANEAEIRNDEAAAHAITPFVNSRSGPIDLAAGLRP